MRGTRRLALFRLGAGLREHRQSGTAGDEREQGRAIATEGHRPGGGGVLTERFGDKGEELGVLVWTVRGTNERGYLCRGDGGTTRERVVAPHGDDEPVPAHRERAAVAFVQRAVDEREVELAECQSLELLALRQLDEVEGYRRMPRAVERYERRDDLAHRRAAVTNPQRPDVSPSSGARRLSCRLGFYEQIASRRYECCAGGREPDPIRLADEELDAELPLELLNSRAQRLLRHPQLLRRSTDVELVRDDEKVAEEPEFHVR